MNKRIPFLIGFFILALAIWVQLTSLPSIYATRARLENLAFDMQLRTRLFVYKKFIESPSVIIDIDDESLNKEGRWPWPRSKLAELMQHLYQAGAVVVVFDMLFPEKENNMADLVFAEIKKQALYLPQDNLILKKIAPLFDDDTKFADSLKLVDTALGMSFIPEKLTINTLPTPALILTTPQEKQLGIIIATGFITDIPQLQNAAKTAGFLNVFPDTDGIVRRVPLLMRYQDKLYASVALEAVRLYLLGNINLITAYYGNDLVLEGVKVGNHVIPTDVRSRVIIPFFGTSYTLPYFSATDVMNNKLPANALRGKIAFVGASAIGIGDLHATAIDGAFPGVEIQASIANGILLDAFTYKPPWSIGAEIFLTLFLGIIFTFVFPYLGPRLLGILIIFIPIFLVMINNWIWQKSGLIISILIPLLLTVILAMTNILYGYLFETRRREHLKEMFGQYVPEKHIDEMLRSSGNYGLKGEDREMTVLFADIRNFTTISEPLTASQIKDLLNEFFTPMTEIIFKHKGTIDKYVGDLIMAFWGAPLNDRRHARHALTAALEMIATVKKLHKEFAERKLPEINIGIGLNTGLMSVGDMGSKFRRNYTVLGDSVNLAARVESLTKYYGVKIIATESTEINQKLFVFRQLDRVRVKGKQNSIAIFELVCLQSELFPELQNEIMLSQEALNYYFNQEWEKARTLFSSLEKLYPHVKLYHLYLERIAEYEHNPPPADWDGVYVHTAK